MQTDEPVTHVGEPGSARQEHWFLRLCARINALCYHWDNYQRLAAAEKAEGDMSRQWLDAEQEAADLRERVRELEGRQGEALPERVRREAAMTPTEQEEYRRTWEETREALKDADFCEELRTIGTREPNQRAKAPDWDNKVRTEVRRRRRATDWQPAKAVPLGPTRGDPCFKVVRSRVDPNRRGPRLRYIKTDRFDAATQTAREIADGQE